MKSQLKFGNFKLVLSGSGRSRKVALFDYTDVAAGHLVEKLSSADINRGSHFKALTADQNNAVGRWLNAHTRRPYVSTVDGCKFPAERDVLHRFLIESQAPSGVTSNDDGDLSSSAVTKWYVEQYCKLNHLKAA